MLVRAELATELATRHARCRADTLEVTANRDPDLARVRSFVLLREFRQARA